jgi:hypothetical protein
MMSLSIAEWNQSVQPHREFVRERAIALRAKCSEPFSAMPQGTQSCPSPSVISLSSLHRKICAAYHPRSGKYGKPLTAITAED